MKLSLGPILFFWERDTLMRFYADMAEQPLDIIYLAKPFARNDARYHWMVGLV